ncbi:MAG: short chain dehydrogenase [Gammaproteobacteria bacterium]|nr:short chain dehydrogenase [Gammaproteobacteria bacterium]
MRILIIGGSGTIGQAVAKELSQRHEIIIAGRQHGDVRVDIVDRKSIEAMYESIGKIDAVIATTGSVHFGELAKMTEEQFAFGLSNKLMGQVNLVSVGLEYINDYGSFTLTSGILNRDPIRYASSAAMINGAVDGFVKSAALEMPRGIRINAVSPTVLAESMEKYGNYFHGFMPVSASQVALAYIKSVEGAQTGNVYCVG